MNDIGSGKRPDRQAKACRYEEGQRCKVQLMIYCLIFSLCGPVVAETGKWAGVDETVVEKFAE